MNIQPPATLILGDIGSGKTDVLTTFIEAGVELFVLITEPGGSESLIDACKRRNLPIDKLHWATVLPAAPGWDAMKSMITTIGSMGYADIQNIKSGVGKEETRKPAMKMLETIANFKCERTGKTYGDVTQWDDTKAFAFDSLSGLSVLSMALTIGYKPAAHQGEWGIAMNFVEQLVLKITSDRKCHFAMTAHVEKELNEISGIQQIMASTLGKKLAPKIPRFFSEVVYAKRIVAQDGKSAKFLWSNVDNNASLKNRALTIGAEITPSFVPVVEAYRARVRQAANTPQSPALKPAVAS